MTPRLVLGLAAAAVISVGAATAAWQANHVPVVTEGAGERFLPDLVDKANYITRIKITQEGETLELSKHGEDWKLAKSGYPIDSAKLKKAIVAVASLVKMEPKTASAKKFPLIELEDPSGKDSKSRRIIMEDKDGKVLANVVLGKVAWGRAGPAQSAQYVRLEGGERSWLVRGLVNARNVIDDWVETKVVKLDKDSIVRVATLHLDDREKLEVKVTGKTLVGSKKFEISGLPEGATVKKPTELRQLSQNLAVLDFNDVRKAREGLKPVTVTEVETDKGLKLEFTLLKDGDDDWVSGKVLEKGKDGKTAEALAEALKGWQFGISDSKAEQYSKRLSMLANVPPAPQTPVPAPQAPKPEDSPEAAKPEAEETPEAAKPQPDASSEAEKPAPDTPEAAKPESEAAQPPAAQ